MENKPQNTTFSIDKERGSYVVPVHGSREMKIYPMLEMELERIGDLNRHATVCFTVGGLLFGIGGGCIWDWINATTAMPSGSKGIAVILLFFSALFFLYGWHCSATKEKEISEIKAKFGESD